MANRSSRQRSTSVRRLRIMTEAVGFCSATPEIADLGHDDVDTGGGDAGDRLDGAGDFTFERANAGHFLHEGGEAERSDIVEEFIAGIGAVRQAAFGEECTGGPTCRRER